MLSDKVIGNNALTEFSETTYEPLIFHKQQKRKELISMEKKNRKTSTHLATGFAWCVSFGYSYFVIRYVYFNIQLINMLSMMASCCEYVWLT